MQKTLTGNADIDEKLILSLDCEDSLNICRTNHYAYQLCKNSILLQHKIKQAREKSTHVLNIIKQRSWYGVILEMNDPGDSYNELQKILHYLHLQHDVDEVVVDHVLRINISRIMSYYDMSIHISIHIIDINELSEILTIVLSEKKLLAFLFHVYYNQLILIL